LTQGLSSTGNYNAGILMQCPCYSEAKLKHSGENLALGLFGKEGVGEGGWKNRPVSYFAKRPLAPFSKTLENAEHNAVDC